MSGSSGAGVYHDGERRVVGVRFDKQSGQDHGTDPGDVGDGSLYRE